MDGTIRDDEGSDPLNGTEGDVGVGDHALFEEDLRTAFPEIPIAQRTAEDHFTAMVGAIQLLADKGDSALEPTRNAQGPDRRVSGLPKLRRRTMPKRLIAKLAVAMAMLLSLAGLANAGMLPDPIQKPIANVLGFDTDDDQGEDADDQGEDADVDGDEVGHGGLVGADPDADDQGGDSENEADDDQGEDADDQGEDSHSEDDDEGEDADDQGEDADDQGEDSHSEEDDEGGDSHSEEDDEGGDSDQ